jgi:hypothetical protein
MTSRNRHKTMKTPLKLATIDFFMAIFQAQNYSLQLIFRRFFIPMARGVRQLCEQSLSAAGRYFDIFIIQKYIINT